jgi:hypothetical protein
MDNLTIQIQNAIGECDHYMPDVGSKEKELVSIIASPLRVDISEDGLNIRNANGCSMFETCQDVRCHLSAAARKLPKIKKG